VLSVVDVGLDGDFNQDGAVDAADYVWWRKSGGSPEDYVEWVEDFGEQQSGNGAGAAAGVPEPATVLLLFAVAITTGARRIRLR
jgi:hypothetical protein